MKIVVFVLFFLTLLASFDFSSIEKTSLVSMKKSPGKNKKKSPSENALLRARTLKVIRKSMANLPKPPKPIPFGSPATKQNPLVDSLGQTGMTPKDNINLNEFPFVLSRCDQVVHFPVQYINNEDDYRVRRPGFVTITAHMTNLFDAKDAQKLVQSTLHSDMRFNPCHLKGARGCVKVTKDKQLRLHNLDYCVDSYEEAENILFLYKEFNRCRLGDSLQPIPPELYNILEELCKKRNKHFSDKERDCEGRLIRHNKKKPKKGPKSPDDELRGTFGRVNPHIDPDDKVGRNTFDIVSGLADDIYNTHKVDKRRLPSVAGNNWEFNRRAYKRFQKLIEPRIPPPKPIVPGDLGSSPGAPNPSVPTLVQ